MIEPESRVEVDVLPDVSGIDRTFHYAVPAALVPGLRVGSIVRVALHGRRVRGFVVALGTPAPPGVVPREIAQVVSLGPPAAMVELCKWAAWRYAGRLRAFLTAASPPTVVRRLPEPASSLAEPAEGRRSTRAGGAAVALVPEWLGGAVREAVEARDAVLRLPPAQMRLPVVLAALEAARGRTGDAMILVESHADARTLARRLEALGFGVCQYPDQWAEAALGGRVVIGTRSVALAPGKPSVILVLDAHSEAYRSSRAPTFDARVLVAERARAEGSSVVFVSPCPSLELLDGRALVTIERSAERHGWPLATVLDVREEDPRDGGYPSRLVALVREALQSDGELRNPVVLVLNRKGRARLLSCSLCRSVQRCPSCGAALVQQQRPPKDEIGLLSCPSCGLDSPALCPSCGSARLRILRPGVGLAREQLQALLGVEVAEMGSPGSEVPKAPVVIGTESVLHGALRTGMVGFLDFDRELLAPRFRAAEQALVLLARAARLLGGREALGGRSGRGRLVVRTSMPEHHVVRSAQAGTPELVAAVERDRRQLLRLPPFSALCEVTGAGAAALVERLEHLERLEGVGGVEVAPAQEDRYLVRAASSAALADSFARLIAGEQGGWAAFDARVEIDPVAL
ncbi:MAG: primosomal protein N' family DNA-binding protein [Acidimicrobiales bacterium]